MRMTLAEITVVQHARQIVEVLYQEELGTVNRKVMLSLPES